MNDPQPPRTAHGRRQDRDRALSWITKATAAGGTGAVLATGGLAVWLATPAHAHPSSHATTPASTGSQTPAQTSTGDDHGLQPPDQVPGGGQVDGGGSQPRQQQPPVVSGGS